MARRHGLLTPREEEIRYWLTQAKADSEIAVILKISPVTVGKHLEHIYAKLRVESRLAAANVA